MKLYLPELERALAGALLLNPALLPAATVEDRDLSLPVVKQAVAGLRAGLADPLLIAEKMRLDAVALIEMAREVPLFDRDIVVGWCKELRDKTRLRELMRLCGEVKETCKRDGASAEDALGQLQSGLRALQRDAGDDAPVGMAEAVPAALDEIKRKATEFHAGRPPGISSGIKLLDDLTGGYQTKQLIVIGGRPGDGKTSFALGAAAHAAITHGVPALVITLEMSRQEMVERLIGPAARVPPERLHAGRVGYGDWEAIYGRTGKLAEAPLWITDQVRTLDQLLSVARRWAFDLDERKAERRRQIVLDYLQLVSVIGVRDHRQEVSEVCRAMKLLAGELDCVVVALSSLNRKSANEDRPPRMDDLRESGDIEFHANMVLFPYRDKNSPGDAVLILDKNRSGGTGTVNVEWVPSFMEFRERATAWEEPEQTRMPGT